MVFIFFTLFIVYSLYENNIIDVEKINVTIDNLGEDLEGLKIAHLSDTHLDRNSFFIDSLQEELENEKPDLIFITGDLVNRDSELEKCGLDKLCKLTSDIAPTYVVSGNHDIEHNYDAWKKIIEDNGAILLDEKLEYYTKGNSSIALMGFAYYSGYYKGNVNYGYVPDDIPVILLAHRPDNIYYYFNEENPITPELVFCGHAHGGQVRIPFIEQGLLSPHQGLFPKYTSGIYDSPYGNGEMIVSRGLGNSRAPIRINDRIHLPIITLKSK